MLLLLFLFSLSNGMVLNSPPKSTIALSKHLGTTCHKADGPLLRIPIWPPKNAKYQVWAPVELLRWVLTQNGPPGQLVARNGQIWGFWAVFGPWRYKKCKKWCTQSGSDEKLMILEPNCKFF